MGLLNCEKSGESRFIRFGEGFTTHWLDMDKRHQAIGKHKCTMHTMNVIYIDMCN